MRQFRELQTRLEREAATRQILSVISQSPDDEQPVFDTILESAARLCGSPNAVLSLIDENEENVTLKAQWGEKYRVVNTGATMPLSRNSLVSIAIREMRTVQIEDLAETDLYRAGDEMIRRRVEEEGVRTILGVPMISNGRAIGTISLRRTEVRLFTADQISLLETFAAQAVIAIENVRQFRELQTRLEREEATREILSVISQSQEDEAPVFETILEKACDLGETETALLVLANDERTEMISVAGKGNRQEYLDRMMNTPVPLNATIADVSGKAILDGEVVHVEDLRLTELYRQREPYRVAAVEEDGVRTALAVPLISGGQGIGTFVLYRRDVRPFAPDQIALLETFAAQAVIAIENSRQFRELQTRLEREAATREILSVISQSPDDEQPVFDILLNSAAKLCGSPHAVLGLVDEAREHYGARAISGDPYKSKIFQVGAKISLARDSVGAVAIREMRVVHENLTYTELYAERDDYYHRLYDDEGVRVLLSVPLISGGQAIGAISLRRYEEQPFSADQIELLETFAAQAVIAIENVRQFRELQTRLEREAATREILSVISQSRDDHNPVFDVVLERTARLSGSPMAHLLLLDGESTDLVIVADWGIRFQHFEPGVSRIPLESSYLVAECVREMRVIQTDDLAETDAYREGDPNWVALVDDENIRTFLRVPLIAGDKAIGAIVVCRQEVDPFSPDEIALVESFAAQAVIAIENVRQFRELQTRLEREAATREILSVISQSRDDEQPVFDVILRNASRLCNAPLAFLSMANAERTHVDIPALLGPRPEFAEFMASSHLPMDSSPMLAVRLIEDAAPVRIDDVREDRLYQDGVEGRVMLADVEGARSLLGVPLISGGRGIGAIGLYRREIAPFTDDDLALVQSFAAQAVIAVQNVRQFRELQTRLEREAATSGILEVISQSRDDEQPVFDVILESAARLCGAPHAGLNLVDESREHSVLTAFYPTNFKSFKIGDKFQLSGNPMVLARCIREAQVIQVEDLADDDRYRQGDPVRVQMVDEEGARTLLCVPLIVGEAAIGCINLRRNEVKPFTQDEIALVETIAAQAVIAIENVRQFRELQTRLEREEATREILSVISQSPDDEQPVFDVILENAAKLCGSPNALLTLADDARENLVYAADWGEKYRGIGPGAKVPLSADHTAALAVRGRKAVQIEDLADTEMYRNEEPHRRRLVDEEGVRTMLGVPLIADNEAIGCITLRRLEVRPFGPDQIALLETFAAQAVIAIENVRQFRELQTRLEREAATREILHVISQHQDDEYPVFNVIVEAAARLCDVPMARISIANPEKSTFTIEASWGDSLGGAFVGKPVPLNPEIGPGRAIVENTIVHWPDMRESNGYQSGQPASIRMVDEEGIMSALIVPLDLKGDAIGCFTLARKEIGLFSEDQISLLKGFAAQAVIAIENVRQFRELQTRLEREAATRQILSVISQSQDNEKPVFDVILDNAAGLCRAVMARLLVVNDERTHFAVAASWGDQLHSLTDGDVFALDPDLAPAKSILENTTIHTPDLTQRPRYKAGDPLARRLADVEGIRTMLWVPLSRGDTAIGSIALNRRGVDPFSDDDIELVKSFAAQAVIAIENVRQFRELQTRLEREAATREILHAISQHQDDEYPVFNVIVEAAARLCDVPMARLVIANPEKSTITIEASWGDSLGGTFVGEAKPLDPEFGPGRAILENTVVHWADVREADSYKRGHPAAVRIADQEGIRSALVVPLDLKGDAIGCLILVRQEVGLFSEDQISLLQGFAAQAVIAIENVRQFRELQTRLEREAATREILSVISQSRDDDQPVFDRILESAANLCEAPTASLLLVDETGDQLMFRARWGEVLANKRVGSTAFKLNSDRFSARAVREAKTIHIRDRADEEGYKRGDPVDVRMVDVEGIHTFLSVPLISGDKAIGCIDLFRREVRPFEERHIDLIETFAAQAVIAIENVRQFKALVEARDAAEAALEDLKKAQERLVQSEKMASLGQLTAGIAHEIKNPLNFVNNFAKLSDELLGELGEILEDQMKSLDEEKREDAEDLFQTVRDNLTKINEHGRRADSIVKNMLLHSRSGPSESQEVSLNPIAEEALNLAYHGARAENSSFNIEMETDFAEDAGRVECFPQDLMRVFLNLISNGMYAAYKRSLEEDGFNPVISVSSRTDGDRVEVQVRDNGGGIPEHVREQIFAPFFTTKPAGEGTGLGLSLSYDIMVKQHGGDLTVESEPGKYTVFTASLPRTLPADTGGDQ